MKKGAFFSTGLGIAVIQWKAIAIESGAFFKPWGGRTMKASKFNILSRAHDDPSKFLLYNTLYDHRILFDDPALNPERLFRKIKQGLPLTKKEREAVSPLKEMGILLEDDVDEQKIFEDWYTYKIRERTDYMQVTILPTMKCNLACSYCFQNEVRHTERMSPKTTEHVIRYLKHRINRVRPERLQLIYFGGEPLTHPEPIKQISESLWHHCRALEGIKIDIGMITNGVLLTPKFVDDLLPYGFHWVKITFDGDREEHDQKRIWLNGKGTFDTIYNNLVQIAGKLKIAIGGNFDQQNYNSLFRLIDLLKISPFADDIMVVRFKPIMEVNATVASKKEGKGISFCEVCTFKDSQVDQILALQEKILRVGLPIQEEPVLGPCEYHQRHSMTIGPNGLIYKCPAFVGLHNLAAGDVFHDEYTEYGEWQLATRKWEKECEKCPYLPNCVGGCRYNSVNKTGNLETKSCEMNLLKASTEAFMKREIKRLSREMGEETELPVYTAA